MQDRFPPTELLDAFSVLQLSYWKKAELSGEVPPCFDAKVDFLGDRYGRVHTTIDGGTVSPIVDAKKLKSQCNAFQTVMFRKHGAFPTVNKADGEETNLSHSSTAQFWANFAESTCVYENSELMKLVVMLTLIPVSSA